MSTQVYILKITYMNCDNRIWRLAEVSSNYSLAQLGYMVLATFDTLAYHLFQMKYDEITYYLREEDCEDLPLDIDWDILCENKLKSTVTKTGEHIEMIYDLGCWQEFDIELVSVRDMEKGHSTSYPKIIGGAGRGIVDDMSDDELLSAIKRIDEGKSSDIIYNTCANEPWDYRDYDISVDNALLKGKIRRIQDGYEDYDEE